MAGWRARNFCAQNECNLITVCKYLPLFTIIAFLTFCTFSDNETEAVLRKIQESDGRELPGLGSSFCSFLAEDVPRSTVDFRLQCVISVDWSRAICYWFENNVLSCFKIWQMKRSDDNCGASKEISSTMFYVFNMHSNMHWQTVSLQSFSRHSVTEKTCRREWLLVSRIDLEISERIFICVQNGWWLFSMLEREDRHVITARDVISYFSRRSRTVL